MSTLYDKTGLTLSQAEDEIPRLRAVNANLLAALESVAARRICWPAEIERQVRAAIAKAKGAA